MEINVKRVYDPIGDDGYRVLVDRLWPRGLKKGTVKIDAWLKDLAPSTPLRKSFGHDPHKWKAFERKYWHELDLHQDLVGRLQQLSKDTRITLLYSATDTDHNNAIALKEYMETHRIQRTED